MMPWMSMGFKSPRITVSSPGDPPRPASLSASSQHIQVSHSARCLMCNPSALCSVPAFSLQLFFVSAMHHMHELTSRWRAVSLYNMLTHADIQLGQRRSLVKICAL